MRLATPYAPPTFLKPCIIVDTVYSSAEKETAVMFREALNASHALAFAADEVRKVEMLLGRKSQSEWIVIQKHKSLDAAIKYHLNVTKKLINGGTEKEWNRGYPDYLRLYNLYCPDYLKDPMEARE